MIPAIALTLALLAEPVPADGLRLAPDPTPAPAAGAAPVGAPPPASGPSLPAALVGLAAGIATLAAGVWAARREEEEAVMLSGEPLVVFVSGHGSASAPGVFAHLAALMGLDPAQTRFFDYRWADGGTDHTRASQYATIDEAADALGGYLAGLSALNRPLYLVGHSKGGASIAELVARWDRGQPGGGRVQGAALLDPPMASGIHGFLQSLGVLWGPLADDGGYDPARCSILGCTDSRRHLGEASGVEVVVVRNPQSGVANFADVPDGLRVYEASDRGPGLLETLFTRPWAVATRLSEAHNAVLHDPRVAECLVAEMRHVGSCTLPQAPREAGGSSWLRPLLEEARPQALPAGGGEAAANPRLPSVV